MKKEKKKSIRIRWTGGSAIRLPTKWYNEYRMVLYCMNPKMERCKNPLNAFACCLCGRGIQRRCITVGGCQKMAKGHM